MLPLKDECFLFCTLWNKSAFVNTENFRWKVTTKSDILHMWYNTQMTINASVPFIHSSFFLHLTIHAWNVHLSLPVLPKLLTLQTCITYQHDTIHIFSQCKCDAFIFETCSAELSDCWNDASLETSGTSVLIWKFLRKAPLSGLDSGVQLQKKNKYQQCIFHLKKKKKGCPR